MRFGAVPAGFVETPYGFVMPYGSTAPALSCVECAAIIPDDGMAAEVHRRFHDRLATLLSPPEKPAYACPQCGPTEHTADCHARVHHQYPPSEECTCP